MLGSLMRGGGAAAGAGEAPKSSNDLYDQVAASSHALNIKSGTVKSLLAGSAKLDADVGSDMILTVEFSQTVNISGITVASDAGLEPTHIKLYTNRLSFGFDDAEDPAVQELVWEDGKQNMTFRLKPGKFGGVNSLTLYVSRDGGESTRLSQLKLTGSVSGVADVSKIQKEPAAE